MLGGTHVSMDEDVQERGIDIVVGVWLEWG
jgi:hypothetical protein